MQKICVALLQRFGTSAVAQKQHIESFLWRKNNKKKPYSPVKYCRVSEYAVYDVPMICIPFHFSLAISRLISPKEVLGSGLV
jgi:hypothetical protein